MKIVIFSDTHMLHRQVKIPDADILIFAGDMTHCRTDQEVTDFNAFLGTLQHGYKIVVAGNHDHKLTADPDQAKSLLSEAIYLQDEAVVVEGIRIYGAPWNPLFNDYACDAFSLPRGRILKKKWDMIPSDIDILVTHTPPSGILDRNGPVSHGCTDLAAAVRAHKPKYHIFGHIHNRHGAVKHGETWYINANVQGKGGVLRSPLVLEYETGTILALENERGELREAG